MAQWMLGSFIEMGDAERGIRLGGQDGEFSFN
jgi:hypothetical protein